MKRILKRILPFVIGGSVVVFAACQQDSQTPTEPGVLLQGRGGPPLKSQIEQVINRIWVPTDPDRRNAHRIASEMFDAVRDGLDEAAEAAAEELITLALLTSDEEQISDDVLDLVDFVSEFSGLPPSTVVSAAATVNIDVTDEEDNTAGMVGVRFAPGQLKKNVAVIVTLQPLPCHPLNQLPIQADDCVTIRTIPKLESADFPELGFLIGVCTDVGAENADLLGLFESQGPASTEPVVKVEEVATPPFIVGFGTDNECLPVTNGSTGSNWLDNFARAGWDKIGGPLASLFAPEPLHATVVLAGAGTLGGRTKNFSNFGWAEPVDELVYEAENYRYKTFSFGNVPGNVGDLTFDDSSWVIDDAPFWGGNAACAVKPAAGVGTTWNLNTEIVLRRYFVLPEGATNVQVAVAIDNDLKGVWVNGEVVSGTLGLPTKEGCAFVLDEEAETSDSYLFPVGGTLNVPGVNLLVIHGKDRGVMSYFDAEIRFTLP